jgi:hypothetical protein
MHSFRFKEKKMIWLKNQELVLVSVLNPVEDDWSGIVRSEIQRIALELLLGLFAGAVASMNHFHDGTKWRRMRLFGNSKGSERKEKGPWSSHPGFPAEYFYTRRHWRLREQ